MKTLGFLAAKKFAYGASETIRLLDQGVPGTILLLALGVPGMPLGLAPGAPGLAAAVTRVRTTLEKWCAPPLPRDFKKPGVQAVSRIRGAPNTRPDRGAHLLWLQIATSVGKERRLLSVLANTRRCLPTLVAICQRPIRPKKQWDLQTPWDNFK